MKALYAGKRITWTLDNICRLDGIENESKDLILTTQLFEHVTNLEEPFSLYCKTLSRWSPDDRD